MPAPTKPSPKRHVFKIGGKPVTQAAPAKSGAAKLNQESISSLAWLGAEETKEKGAVDQLNQETETLSQYLSKAPKKVPAYSVSGSVGRVMEQQVEVAKKSLGGFTKSARSHIVASAIFAAAFISLMMFFGFSKPSPRYLPKYSVFASKPLVLGSVSNRVFGQDSKAEVLNKVFEVYKCPLAGMGEVFVEEADKNDIPYWLVAAIGFQESSCGKVTPKPLMEGVPEDEEATEENTEESYNAWGWGVYGDNVYMFDGWEHGIKVVSKYMGNTFYSEGVTDLCEIEKIYTPPSEGSWCEHIAHFRDVIEGYEDE